MRWPPRVLSAGGHRGTFDPVADPASQPLAQLLHAVIVATKLPVVAAGGLMTATDIADVLAKWRGGGPAGNGVPAR